MNLDKIAQKLDRLVSEQARQGAILEEHQRRSLANEEAVELIRSELDPLKKHVAMWAGAGKVLAVLGTVASMVGVIVKIWMP